MLSITTFDFERVRGLRTRWQYLEALHIHCLNLNQTLFLMWQPFKPWRCRSLLMVVIPYILSYPRPHQFLRCRLRVQVNLSNQTLYTPESSFVPLSWMTPCLCGSRTVIFASSWSYRCLWYLELFRNFHISAMGFSYSIKSTVSNIYSLSTAIGTLPINS